MTKHKIRNVLLIAGVILSYYLSLNFSNADFSFIPAETAKNLLTMIEVSVKSLFDSSFDPETVTADLPYYTQTAVRLKMGLIAMLSGIIICLAGTIFQTVFKNPIASPNLLGISTGVSIGNIVFILTFQLQAMFYLTYRYFFCYAFAALFVMLTVASGKLANIKTKEFSVEVMILIGMMISHLGSVFTTYFSIMIEGDETGLAELMSTITSGDTIFADNESFIVFSVVTLITVLPIVLIRYRFNVVAFNDDEVYTMGVSNSQMRLIGLVCGSLMATAAMIHCGDVGFLSMCIPFICRRRMHADFREVAFTSACVGAILSLLSRSAYSIALYLLPFPIPASTIITLVVLPVFVYSLIKRESAFT